MVSVVPMRSTFPTIISVLLILVSVIKAANDIGLERIIMQLRSQVDADSSELHSNIKRLTTSYLNDYFGAYYSTNYELNGFFLEVTLSIASLGIHGVEGSFITTLEMDGSLSFDHDVELPSESFADTLLRNAFQGHNERIYLNHLLSNSGSDSSFLHQLTHIFIDIGGATVAETEIQRTAEAVSSGDDNVNRSSNSTLSSTKFAPDSQGDNESAWFMDEQWATIAIFVAAGVVGVLLLVGCCFYFGGSKTVIIDDEDDDLGDEPIKVLELPVKQSRNFRVPGSSSTPISQSNTEGSDSDSLDEQMGCSPPSPERSLASQDSSKFTYSNNNHSSNLNTSRCSLGSFSKFSMDMQASIDLGGSMHQSNYRPNTISHGTGVPPFGQDISAIEKHHHLSLIQEEDDDEEMGHHHLARARKNGSSRPCRIDHQFVSSRRSFRANAYEERPPKNTSRSRNHGQVPSSSRRFSFGRRNEGLDTSETSIDMDTCSSDVIADLRNLSIQIEKQRKSRRAPDPR
jgi:hypothetical protein